MYPRQVSFGPSSHGLTHDSDGTAPPASAAAEAACSDKTHDSLDMDAILRAIHGLSDDSARAMEALKHVFESSESKPLDKLVSLSRRVGWLEDNFQIMTDILNGLEDRLSAATNPHSSSRSSKASRKERQRMRKHLAEYGVYLKKPQEDTYGGQGPLQAQTDEEDWSSEQTHDNLENNASLSGHAGLPGSSFQGHDGLTLEKVSDYFDSPTLTDSDFEL